MVAHNLILVLSVRRLGKEKESVMKKIIVRSVFLMLSVLSLSLFCQNLFLLNESIMVEAASKKSRNKRAKKLYNNLLKKKWIYVFDPEEIIEDKFKLNMRNYVMTDINKDGVIDLLVTGNKLNKDKSRLQLHIFTVKNNKVKYIGEYYKCDYPIKISKKYGGVYLWSSVTGSGAHWLITIKNGSSHDLRDITYYVDVRPPYKTDYYSGDKKISKAKYDKKVKWYKNSKNFKHVKMRKNPYY